MLQGSSASEHRSWVAGEEIPQLVHELMKAANQLGGPPVDADSRVLLDVEVEDVRCVIVRRHNLGSSHRATLSPREMEIVRMVAQGYPNKAIAAVLEISAWTVSTHVRRIFAKLGVKSRAAMVASLFGGST